MRILLVNDYYPPRRVGGAEVAVAELAGALLKLGHDVHVLTGSDGESQAGEAICNSGLEAYWGSPTDPKRGVMRRVQRLLLASPKGLATLDRLEQALQPLPDIVHTHNVRVFGLALWRWFASRGVPVVHTAHDYFLVCPFRGMYRKGRPCETACLECRSFHWRRAQRLSGLSAFVTASRHVMATHESAIADLDAAPVRRVIANGIAAPARRAERERPERPLTVGYLGRLSRNKGAFAFVAAARALADAPIRFLVAGKGEAGQESALRDVAPANLRFLGQVERDAFFADIDVLAVPAEWHEPFGLVVGEAQAFGLPVVVSDRGALPEMIRPGVTGDVLSGNHVSAALAATLERLIVDPQIVESWRRALQDHPARPPSWAEAASAHDSVYRDLLARQGDRTL